MALPSAKSATRNWTTRLLTVGAVPPRHLVDKGQGFVGEQSVAPSGDLQLAGHVVGRLSLFHPDHRGSLCAHIAEGHLLVELSDTIPVVFGAEHRDRGQFTTAA